MKLQGKVALITGASRGIGRAVAEGFAREGAKLFLVGHADKSALEETLAGIRSQGGQAEGGLFDVGSYEEVQRLANQVERRYGTLDILVNNAGIIAPVLLLELPPAQWDLTIRTHLHGTFYGTREMVNRFLKPKRAGKIINVTAPTGLCGGPFVADYAAAKAAIINFTKSAAQDFFPLNIQVNCVLPVATTRMTDALAAFYQKQSDQQAMKRVRKLVLPEVVVPVFLFFASSDSDYVTGQTLAADGGLSIFY